LYTTSRIPELADLSHKSLIDNRRISGTRL